MPKKMEAFKPQGMIRAGGMLSSGSAPNPMAASKGGTFAALENALLRTKKPNPKKLAKGGGKQFQTQAGGF